VSACCGTSPFGPGQTAHRMYSRLGPNPVYGSGGRTQPVGNGGGIIGTGNPCGIATWGAKDAAIIGAATAAAGAPGPMIFPKTFHAIPPTGPRNELAA